MHNKRKIFIFWIGDSNRIATLITKLKEQGFDVALGPSKAEHKFLYVNFPYYRKSYDEKIWSFCSDVWRVYKLSKEDGMYMDTSVHIGDELACFYDENIANKVVLFRETKHSLDGAIMFSGIKENHFFAQLLELYKTDIIFDVRIYPIGPDLISSFVFQRIGNKMYGFDDLDLGWLHLKGLLNIRDPKTIKKIGSGSWLRNADANEKNMENLSDNNFWKFAEEKWKKGKKFQPWKQRVHMYAVASGNAFSPNPITLREQLDNTRDATKRKEIVKIYHSLKSRVNIKDLLIWSQMYFVLKNKRKK